MSLQRTPPGGAWVGGSSQGAALAAGWTPFEGVEALLASRLPWAVVVLNDPSAVLREADFQAVWEHAPWARIIRPVGPYRIGINRTDPQWPRLTTWVGNVSTLCSVSPLTLCDRCVLPTAEYTEVELPAGAPPKGLRTTRIALSVSDRDLHEVWADTIAADGELVVTPDVAEIVLVDADDPLNEPIGQRAIRRGSVVVRLSSWPWTLDSDGGWAESKSTPPGEILHRARQQLAPLMRVAS